MGAAVTSTDVRGVHGTRYECTEEGAEVSGTAAAEVPEERREPARG